MNAPTATPVTDLARVAENDRAFTISAMADDELFAARRLLVEKIRQLEADRAQFLTASGAVKARLSDAARTTLFTVNRNLEIYRRCVTLIDPAVEAASGRRTEAHLRDYAHEQVAKRLRAVADRLTRLAEAAARAADGVESPDRTASHLDLVLEVQRDIAWSLPNASFESIIRDAVKADA